MSAVFRKNCILAVVSCLAAFPAFGEIPRTLDYAGFISDTASGLPVSGAKDMKFILYDAESGGNILFSENRCGVPLTNGKYFVEIGSTSAGQIPDSIFTGNAATWLEVRIDPDGDCAGIYDPVLPRIKMSAAPYSFATLYASTASAATSVFKADIIDSLPSTAYGALTVSTNLFVQGGIYVGLISPGQKLSVTGLIESTTGGFVFPDGSVQVRAAALTKWELNEPHMYTTNAGFTGMGTGPDTLAQLHVSSGAGETGNIFLVSTGTSNLFRVTGEGKAYATYFYGDGSGLADVTLDDTNKVLRTGDAMSGNLTISGSNLTIIGNGAGMSNSLEITTDPAKGVYHFVISTSGYAGVGTPVPLYPFHIHKDGYQGVMLAVSSGTGNSLEIKGDGEMTAQRYFGDGSAISDIVAYDNTRVWKTGDTMSGSLTISGSSLTVGGEGSFSGHLSLGSSVTALGEIKTSSSLAAAGGFFSGAITASSGTFTLSGANQYSIETASGIKVNSGLVEAPYFKGSGLALTNIVTTDTARVLKTGDAMSGNLKISGSSLTLVDGVADFYAFSVSTSPSDYDLVITTKGNAGIGVSNPSTPLELTESLAVSNPPGGFSNIRLNPNFSIGYIYFRDEALAVNQNKGVLGFGFLGSQQPYDFMYKAGTYQTDTWTPNEVFRVKSDKFGNWNFLVGKAAAFSKFDSGVDLAVSTGGAGSVPVLYASTSDFKASVNLSTQSLTRAFGVGGDMTVSSSVTAQGGFYGDVYGDIKTSSITLTGNLGLGKNDKIAKLEIQENGSEQYILVAGTNTSNLAAVEPYDFVITTAGKVGIGVDNPSTYLHARGSLRIGDENDTASAYVKMSPSQGDTYISFEESASLQKGSFGFKAGSRRFKYCPDSVAICADGNEALGIEQNGYVGIGGADPAYMLHVNGGLAVTSSVTANGGFYGDGSSLGGILVEGNSVMNGVLTVDSTMTVSGGAFSVGISTLAVSQGRVGVSTAAPAAVLDVSGSVSFGAGADKSTFTAQGFWRPRMLTTAEISALIPGQAGEIIANSDINDLCVSTGTVAGDWALINSKGGSGCF